jgi:hypothetical protein
VGGLTSGRPGARLSLEAVERRLVTMRRAVGQLSDLGPVGPARLDRDPAAGLVIERVLALLDDLAVEINREPAAGACPAGRPGTPDGPYHVLLQLCLDTEPEQVAGVVTAAVAAYAEYVRRVSATPAPATQSSSSGPET